MNDGQRDMELGPPVRSLVSESMENGFLSLEISRWSPGCTPSSTRKETAFKISYVGTCPHIPTQSCVPALGFPYTRALSLHRIKNLFSHGCPKRLSATDTAHAMCHYLCNSWLLLSTLGSLVGWYCCSSYGIANPFSSFSPFSTSSIGTLCSVQWLVVSICLSMSGSDLPFQEAAISGSFQHAFLGIQNNVSIWWLYMGWILKSNSLWIAFPSFSASYFVSTFDPI